MPLGFKLLQEDLQLLLQQFKGVVGADAPQKRTTEAQYTLIGDYETALGMDVIINHVGDCFD